MVDAEISTEACASFSNDNGKLVCETPSNGPGKLPKGTFLGSCGGCSFDEESKSLSCESCKNSRGTTNASKLDVTGCRSVGNNDGYLVCEDTVRMLARYVQKQQGLPDGDYLDSCSGCNYTPEDNTFVLSCMACNTMSGHTKSSRIVMHDLCPVSNSNGQLTCEEFNGPEDTAAFRITIKTDGGEPDTVIYAEKELADGWTVDAEGRLIQLDKDGTNLMDQEQKHEIKMTTGPGPLTGHDEL